MRLINIIIFLISSALLGRAQEVASGHWEGSVQIPDRELKLIVDLAQQKGGTWTGSITIPGLNVKGASLADIAVKDSDASFSLKSSGRGLEADFKGHLTADNTLAGDFLQAGNTAPFVLKRSGDAQVESPARSTAIAKEMEGEWKGDYELNGYARHVTLKLANRGEEGASAELVIVGKKINNLPVDLVTQEENLLTIDSHQTGMGIEGRFKKETGEIKGVVIQGTIEAPLVLHHTP
jgi:hypothetical protein